MSPRIYDYSEEKVAKLRADLTELRAENERLRAALKLKHELRRENERLRAALKEKNTYLDDDGGFWHWNGSSKSCLDCGQVSARGHDSDCAWLKARKAGE